MFNSPSVLLVAILLLLTFAPHLFYVIGDFNSLGPSLIFCSSAAILLIYIKANRKISWGLKKTVGYMIVFVGVYSIVALFYGLNSKVFTVFGLALLIYQASIVGGYLVVLDKKTIFNSIYFLLIICIISGWLGFLKTGQVGVYSELPKGIIPFREHSHYGLVAGSYFMIVANRISARKYILVAANMLLLSLLLPNFTLLIFTCISLMVFSINRGFKSILLIMMLGLCGLLIISNGVDFEYFVERWNNSSGENTTSLVWFQGVELAMENLKSSNGLGIGFQNLGVNGVLKTESGEIINLVAGVDLNLEDGGFLAAKLISEFGVVGLVIVIILIAVFVLWFINGIASETRKMRRGDHHGTNGIFFAMIASLFVELIFRGVGYFSVGLYMAFVGYFAMINERHSSDNL